MVKVTNRTFALPNPMINKYKLSDKYIMYKGMKLYQIVALQAFDNIQGGEYGGYIMKEDNLSQLGKCWISVGSIVFGDALVYGDAKVLNGSIIHDRAQIGNKSIINNSEVYQEAEVYGDSFIINSKIRGIAKVVNEYILNSEVIQ